jgi:hypothetical protein
MSTLRRLVEHPLVRRTPELQRSTQQLQWLYLKMEQYLNRLDPRCMNFLQWHETIPGKNPPGRC